MNRREAIAALTAVPGLTTIEVARLHPDDIIVLECDGTISNEVADRLERELTAIWPSHKIVVLGDGMRLKVVSRS